MSRTQATEDAFARFVTILGRGPGRSRALSRAEARAAFGMVLAGEADPHQVGAFLMLLRFRGEDAEEIAGIVEAIRDDVAARVAAGGGVPVGMAGSGPAMTGEGTAAGVRGAAAGDGRVDLDWPSYGAGRTRGAPWYLLAALALARAGVRVLMHGSNEFSGGIPAEQGLAALGLAPAGSLTAAKRQVAATGFAYLPIAALSPPTATLLGLRRLFGLRSPVNTAARLVNPADAPAGVDGVFHPAYIAVHLGVAERLGRSRLLVLKGGGGEAERAPLKPTTAHLWDGRTGASECVLPADPDLSPLTPQADTPALLAAVWRGVEAPPTVVATIQATIGLGLLATGRAADPAEATRQAAEIWAGREQAGPRPPSETEDRRGAAGLTPPACASASR
ncbi:MAG: hypothetical protein BGO51_08700 [Rhodospirillales bacterium 69-11]|nr:glycosyl transferase [Rhodospirillales bacterium]OJW26009.1 MAG: hypothetical protein BGO51_08700 [Rhodospirillales bacterium 69-11]